MKYTRQLDYHRRRRFLFRIRLFFASLCLTLLVAGGYLYYIVVIEQQSNTKASTTSMQTSSYFAPNVKVFRTPHFQFQANQTWSEVAAENTAGKYVYRSRKASLIEHELVIYVNQIPDTLSANRVFPVNPKGDSELLPVSVSEHCLKTAGGSRIDNPQVTMEKVKFRCDADSTNYSVIVGMVDGSSIINLKRPDGSSANYSFLYTNLRAVPESSQLNELVESFQTR